MLNKPVAIIGYSGHAFVVAGIIESMGKTMAAYCDNSEKVLNPFDLHYLGKESEERALEYFNNNDYFICIGDNNIRQKVFNKLVTEGGVKLPMNAIHKMVSIHRTAQIEEGNVMVSAGVVINPLAYIEKGAICNTSCVIEHECRIGAFAHIGPGAVLCGNVQVGSNTFIGANAVVKQGISIGKNVMVGAGCVVIENIPDNATVVGNPHRLLIK